MLAAGLGGCSKTEQPEKLVVDVHVALVRSSDIPIRIDAPATLFPKQQANIAPQLSARIQSMPVHKGEAVSVGALLVKLDARDAAALAEAAQSSVKASEENLNRTVNGNLPIERERVNGQLESAKAALDQATKVYERRKTLYAQGAIAGRELLQSQTDLAAAKAQFDVAQKSSDLFEQQSGKSAASIANSQLEEARARLRSARVNLDYLELRSPFRGTVTEQFAYPGDIVRVDTPIFTIMDLSTLTARAQVPAEESAGIALRQACTFVSSEGAGTAQGEVTVVNRAVDLVRHTVEVWCEIRRPSTDLRAGSFGKLAITLRVVQGGLLVPVSAVQLAEGSADGVVNVVDRNNIAHQRTVHTGARIAQDIQIESGLQAGDKIVIQGGYGLPDGTQVRIRDGNGQ
jgi:multidrug efflux pump subunit AcrA (membrane-fusion protein)